MIAARIRLFLNNNGVKYATIQHATAYTAHEIAASAHIPGKELAKTVMVQMGDRVAMVVLPATDRVRTEDLQRVVGAEPVRVAREHEFERLFPDCESGAMPPFGNLYGVDVYVHPDLTEDETIAFNAGSHTELIRMKYNDFARLVHPKPLAVA